MKFLLIFFSFLYLCAFEPMLLKNYKGDENLTNWVMSEKLDGVRGLYDGKSLKSRSDKFYKPPKFWLSCFPDFALDGEIYSSKIDFENITSIVNSQNDNGWNLLRYYVFDVPNASGNLEQRLEKLRLYLSKNECKQIDIIEQIPAISHKNVNNFLNDIIAKGGEGIVIRDKFAPYQSGRSKSIKKIKKFLDAECKVIAHNRGKGKYKDVLGSLTCKDLKNDKVFKIGSGFSDNQRKNPPKIGDIITYKYQNLSKYGIPRFPVFLRVRNEY